MIINHNMQAMNANRQMGANQTNASKNMEKLSSGLRINRAGDDAAGLSISEKMRGQIRGLNQASRNSQDGISLIQTAEGALDETHSILQRIRELAVQSANDTNVVSDRSAIKEEIGQLTKELDRIAQTTEFNTQNLLGGGFKGTFQIGANQDQTIDLTIGNMGSSALGLANGVKLNTVTAATAGNTANILKEGSYTVNAAGDAILDTKGNTIGALAADGKITLGGGAGVVDLGHAITASSTIQVAANGNIDITLKTAGTQLAAGDYKVSGANLMNGDKVVGTLAGVTLTKSDGSTVDMTTNYGLIAADLATGKTFSVTGVNVDTAANATGAITAIDAAIKTVSNQRSQLGAVQNRLEHTIKNLNNAAENTQSAESRVRDVDMAKEMMEMTKNNILNQAAQAMLAQANQAPQQVLQLLR